VLFGGAGNDTFVFNVGDDFDTISDFDANGDDIVDLSDFGLPDFAALQALMSEVDGDVQIDLGNGDVLQFDNTSISDLDAMDFVF